MWQKNSYYTLLLTHLGPKELNFASIKIVLSSEWQIMFQRFAFHFLDIYLIYYLHVNNLYSISFYSDTLSTLNLYLYPLIGYSRGFILQSICEFDVMLELWGAVYEKGWSFFSFSDIINVTMQTKCFVLLSAIELVPYTKSNWQVL